MTHTTICCLGFENQEKLLVGTAKNCIFPDEMLLLVQHSKHAPKSTSSTSHTNVGAASNAAVCALIHTN